MNASEPRELELTPELLDYAKRVAIEEAKKRCSNRIDFDDVVQDVHLRLLRKPPKYDPSRNAKPETLIHTIVQRAVINYATREGGKVRRLESFPMSADDPSSPHDGPTPEQARSHQSLTGAWPTDHEPLEAAVEEILRFIDNEDSRALCRLFLECDGNKSKMARRLNLTEGAVRQRLERLIEVQGPKLIAAGLNPFATGGER